MSDDKYSVIKYDLIIPVSRARVWNRLTQPSAASRLFSEDASSQLASDGAGGLSGRLRVGAELFKLRMRPFDALATSAG